MSITGHEGGPPTKSGVPVSDIGCALFVVYGIMSALIGRGKTGRGQYVDGSLFEAAIAFSIWDISEYWGTGKIPTPLGTANRYSAPYQAVRASDTYFVMGANSNKLFQQLCDLLGRPELFSDARFANVSGRLANRIVLIEELEKSFATKTADEWVDALLAVGIPAGPICNIEQALNSEHAKAREAVMEIRPSGRGPREIDRLPGEAVREQAARAAPSAAAGRAQRRDPERARARQQRHRRIARGRSDPVSGQVDYEVKDGVAHVTFNRPEARNAMTWAMYDGLARACEAIVSDETVRVALLRGAGGAFVAGTDIQQFTAFEGGKDGLAYEKRIEASISQIENVGKPMVAVIDGFATGGGLIIAASCDFRLATPEAQVRRADRAHARQLHLGRQRDRGCSRISERRARSAC